MKRDPRRGPRLGKKVQLPSVVRRPLLTAQRQNSFQMPEQIPRRRTQEVENIFVYNERLLKLALFSTQEYFPWQKHWLADKLQGEFKLCDLEIILASTPALSSFCRGRKQNNLGDCTHALFVLRCRQGYYFT